MTNKQVYDIARLKKQDLDKKLKPMSLRAMARAIVGTARGMGIEVVPDEPPKIACSSASVNYISPCCMLCIGGKGSK